MKPTSSSLVTDRKRTRGLGSAHSGTGHFWLQRVSGAALVPLTVFFVATLIALAGAGRAEALATVRNPFFGLALAGFILAGAYHMRLGMQVVIEDYVHAEGPKLALLILNTVFAAFFALAGVYAVVRISLGS